MTPEQLAAEAALRAAFWGPIILAVIGGVFSILRAVSVYLIDKRVKDRELAAVLENAVGNSLGTIQQAVAGAASSRGFTAPVLHADIPAAIKPGVQYVLDHAAEAVKRFKQTPEAIADKIVSRVGLAEIKTNLAISASDTSTVAAPLAPVAAEPIASPSAIVRV